MKKKIVMLAILVAVILPVVLLAQKSPIEAIFDKYSGKDGFTVVNVTKDMFSLFTDIIDENEDAQDFKDLASGLETVKILSYNKESKSGAEAKELYEALRSAIPFKDYTELLTVDDNDTKVKMVVKRDSDKVREFLLLVGEKDSATLIWIKGNINLKSLSKLSKHLKIDALKDLDKFTKHGGSKHKPKKDSKGE